LILQFTLHQPITRSSIGNDVGFADDAGSVHVEWTEDAILKKVSVEFAGDFVNQDSKRCISKIGIAPLRAWWVRERNAFDDLKHIFFCVIFAEVEGLRIVSKAAGVAQELADGYLLPGGGCAREVLCERIF